MIIRTLITLSGALALASCGPEDLDGIDYEPEVRNFGSVTDNIAVEHDKDADQILLTDGVVLITLPRDEGYDVHQFKTYQGGGSSSILSFAETSSGGGYAAVTALAVADGFAGIAGGKFARLSDTELPDDGTATFTGKYAGYIVGTDFFKAERLLAGDVELTADFDDGEISGVISNRFNQIKPEKTLGDMVLNATDIDDAGFAGTTTGGAFNDGTASVSDGSYSGLFVGEDGEEIVGGVSVQHVRSGTDLVEVGVFIAEQ